VEGFAFSPKFPTNMSMGVWLCRDVKLADNADAVRWFNPFAAEGTDIQTDVTDVQKQCRTFNIFPNQVLNELTISNTNSEAKEYFVQVYSCIGQLMVEKKQLNFPTTINVSNLKSGIYFVKILSNHETEALKTIIKI
jgi:hypothetical protein